MKRKKKKSLDNENLKEYKNNKRIGCIQKLLIFLIILIAVGVGVYKFAADFFNTINLSAFTKVVGYLNEDYSANEIIDDEITVQNYNSFVNKASTAELTIFTNGLLDLNRDVTLTNNLSLTGNEFGAFLNKVINQQNINEMSDMLEFKQITIFNDGSLTKLKTVILINLEDIHTQISGIFSDFPKQIYLTSISVITIQDNELIITNSVLTFNQLEQSKNNEITNLINSILKVILLDEVTTDFNFINSISYLIKDILLEITNKTNSLLNLNNYMLNFNVN